MFVKSVNRIHSPPRPEVGNYTNDTEREYPAMKHVAVLATALICISLMASVCSTPPPPSTNSTTAHAVLVTAVPGVVHPNASQPEEGELNEADPPSMPVSESVGPIVPTYNVTTVPTPVGNISIPSRFRRQATCPSGPFVPFAGNHAYDGGPELQPADPSGAQSGRFIFATANTFASFSVDGGLTFHTLRAFDYADSPRPPIHGGLSGDQVVQYIRKVDNFVWLQQYWNAAGGNMLRLVTFCPTDLDPVRGITKFSTLDLTSATFGFTGGTWMDYPDMAVGDNFLYISIDAVGISPTNGRNIGIGLFVIKIPFDVLKGSGTIWYTDPALGRSAYLGHISQNAMDTVYWAGHSVVGSEMQVFWWPEAGITYFWDFVPVKWAGSPGTGGYISRCPGGANWLDFAWRGVVGATRRTATEVWFAWTAEGRIGTGLPQPHIQVVQIGTAGGTVTRLTQWQIWHPDIAYAYPALSTNGCGEVGIAVAFGGVAPGFGTGSFSASGAVARTTGPPLPLVYYTVTGNTCQVIGGLGRFGDYFTVRPASPDPNQFAAFLYTAFAAPSPNFPDLNQRQEWIRF